MAYSAVVVLRSSNNREVTVQLIQARASAAPIQNITIPRLEPLAHCIGACVTSSFGEEMHINHISVFYWTDSPMAVSWIRGEDDWGAFINFLVKEI
jgi:hypothetical protein